MQISRMFVRRGAWAPAILLCGILAVSIVPCVTLDAQDASQPVQLCGERLIDAVLDLCDFKIYDPVEKRAFNVYDDRARPAIVSSAGATRSSGVHRVVGRVEVYHIFNRRDAGGLSMECCRTQCTIANMVRYCAIDN